MCVGTTMFFCIAKVHLSYHVRVHMIDMGVSIVSSYIEYKCNTAKVHLSNLVGVHTSERVVNTVMLLYRICTLKYTCLF